MSFNQQNGEIAWLQIFRSFWSPIVLSAKNLGIFLADVRGLKDLKLQIQGKVLQVQDEKRIRNLNFRQESFWQIDFFP